MREDPLVLFKFQVKLGQIIEGYFTECSGLSAEREVEIYKEGGVNGYEHKLPGRLKYGNVTLRRGMTTSDTLWSWFNCNSDDQTNFFKVNRLTVTITQLDQKGNAAKEWSLHEAYPVKWKGPDLKSDGNQIAVETLEIAHHGIHQIKT